ncbi:hypothetical protein RRG08_005315 [Elysia crispata]|uniref:Uncharacterized protein n=1 Tax=Elysia crispata TaxID=231223 RepID=A0AAE0Z143_9GAST|nr:hypothetical protein RRG08_005315 [Elysia crispata]
MQRSSSSCILPKLLNHERILEEQIASDEFVDSIDKMVEELEAVGGRHCSSPVQGLPLTETIVSSVKQSKITWSGLVTATS